jgi:hypothetical protein
MGGVYFQWLIATTTAADLTFDAHNRPDWFGLDDVTITEQVAARSPEPASILLMALGVFAVGGIRRFSGRKV